MADNFVDVIEAQKALKQAQKNISKVQNKALEEAEKLIADKLKENTPVWNGSKSQGKRGAYMLEHAKDHIVYSKVKNGMAEVGFDDEVAWRVHFVEFGTIKQLPKAFVQKTQIQVEQEVIDLIGKIIGEALNQ